MNKEYYKLPSEELNEISDQKEINESIIKSFVGVLPYIGTALNEVLFEYPNKIKQKRINQLVEQLKNELENQGDKIKSIKEEYLKTDDFYDHTISTFEKSIKIKSEIKRSALVKIYVESFSNSANFETDSYSSFMNFITELSEFQIIILKFISSNEDNLIEIGSFSKFHEIFTEKHAQLDIDKYEFKYLVNDLVNKSLISTEDGLNDYESNTSMIVDDKHREASIKITSFGKRFIQFLSS